MLIIGNGRLVTRDAGQPFFENGAVAIDGTTIKKVGTLEEIKKEFPEAEFVDAKGGVIMPAFINTHEHIYSAMARGLSIKGYDPHGFLDILDGLWWTIDRHLTLEQTYLSAMATYIDSIKNGVTTVFDHHASFGQIKDSLFAIEDAAKEFGVRACLCYEVSDRDGMDKSREAVLENARWIKHALADDTDMIAGMMVCMRSLPFQMRQWNLLQLISQKKLDIISMLQKVLRIFMTAYINMESVLWIAYMTAIS